MRAWIRTVAVLLLLVSLVPLAPPAAAIDIDVGPDQEQVTTGTSSGFLNLFSDDGANWAGTEGAVGGNTNNYFASSQSIAKGTQTAGTYPSCVNVLNDDVRCTWQEGDQASITDLLADTETLTKANSVSGALSDLNTDNAASRVVSELNTGGGGSGGAPAFVNVGTIASSTGADVTPPLYTGHAANDIILVFGWVRDEDDTVTITDYTLISGFPHDLASGTGRYWAFWKRHDGSEGNPLFDKSTTTGDTYAVAIGYSGAVQSGDPWEVVGTWGDTTTNPLSLTEITTLTANSLVVVPAGYQDNDLAACTVTGTDPAAYTEHYQEAPAGLDGAICVSEAARTDAGGTGTVTVSWGTLSDPTGGIVLALKPEPAANYELEYRLAFTSETCADTRRLTVNAWKSVGTEDAAVQVLDSTETTYTTRATVTATADGTTITYDLTADEWDAGDVQVRFLGTTETGDSSQGEYSMDYVVVRCVPAADYELEVKHSWTGVSTTGTEWRLFVEGREGAANPEQLDARIYAADEVALSGIVCSITSTTEAEYDCGTLTADQRDGGTPDVQLVDATQTGDTSQSTVDLDTLRIRRTFDRYELLQAHKWVTTIGASDAGYSLRVRAFRSDLENCLVQLWDWGSSTWTTRITVSSGAETLYTYTLAATERQGNGTVMIRWIGSDETSGDETVSTCTVDQEIIRRTDNPPTATLPDVTPDTGDTAQVFTFTVTYTDTITCPATSATVTIDGGAPVAMSAVDPGDTNCADGKGYTVDQGPFSAGDHDYLFTVDDGVNPAVNTALQTFTVTEPPPPPEEGGSGGDGGGLDPFARLERDVPARAGCLVLLLFLVSLVTAYAARRRRRP